MECLRRIRFKRSDVLRVQKFVAASLVKRKRRFLAALFDGR